MQAPLHTWRGSCDRAPRHHAHGQAAGPQIILDTARNDVPAAAASIAADSAASARARLMAPRPCWRCSKSCAVATLLAHAVDREGWSPPTASRAPWRRGGEGANAAHKPYKSRGIGAASPGSTAVGVQPSPPRGRHPSGDAKMVARARSLVSGRRCAECKPCLAGALTSLGNSRPRESRAVQSRGPCPGRRGKPRRHGRESARTGVLRSGADSGVGALGGRGMHAGQCRFPRPSATGRA